jgi:hypothetical protein
METDDEALLSINKESEAVPEEDVVKSGNAAFGGTN